MVPTPAAVAGPNSSRRWNWNCRQVRSPARPCTPWPWARPPWRYVCWAARTWSTRRPRYGCWRAFWRGRSRRAARLSAPFMTASSTTAPRNILRPADLACTPCRGPTNVGAISPGCVGYDRPRDDTSHDARGAGSARAFDDRSEAGEALHLECLRKRSGRSLPAAANWQSVGHRACRSPAVGVARNLPQRARISAPRRPDAEVRNGASGTTFCRDRLTITIDNIAFREARERDSLAARYLPGCLARPPGPASVPLHRLVRGRRGAIRSAHHHARPDAADGN